MLLRTKSKCYTNFFSCAFINNFQFHLFCLSTSILPSVRQENLSLSLRLPWYFYVLWLEGRALTTPCISRCMCLLCPPWPSSWCCQTQGLQGAEGKSLCTASNKGMTSYWRISKAALTGPLAVGKLTFFEITVNHMQKAILGNTLTPHTVVRVGFLSPTTPCCFCPASPGGTISHTASLTAVSSVQMTEWYCGPQGVWGRTEGLQMAQGEQATRPGHLLSSMDPELLRKGLAWVRSKPLSFPLAWHVAQLGMFKNENTSKISPLL